MSAAPRPLAILAAYLLATMLAGCDRAPAARGFAGQSLLLITIDTLRADRLGSYGFASADTPHLDALAADGVRFENCYTSVPLTLPAHANMFTGRYPFAVGVHTNGSYQLPASEVTLAEELERAGYETFAAVSAYVLASKFGLDQGFGRYDDSLGTVELLQAVDSEITADRVYAKFSDWLRDRRQGRFFAWVHFYDPHLPYEPPGDYRHRFAADPYSGEIAFVDSQVGRIVADLRSRDLLDTTLIVVASDHGEAFREHVEEGHGLLCYDETLRVPLILSAPGRLRPGVVADRVRLIDLMPTLLDLLQVAPPADMQGRSFADLLGDGGDREPRSVYFESLAGAEYKNWAPLRGIIVDQYKYIELPEPELYDLESDPAERSNLHRSLPRVAGRLADELSTVLQSAGGDVDAARRTPSAEDLRHLRALGYVDSATSGSDRTLDPKMGIEIDMTLRTIRARINRGEADIASRLLDELVAEQPDLEMADLYDLRHALAAQRADEDAAVAALEDGIARFPAVEALRFKLALYLFNAGRYAEMERVAAELLERNPAHSGAIILRGRAAESRGDLQRALEHYRRALNLEPGSIPLRARIADCLAQTGQTDQALSIYDALLASGALDGDADKLYKAAVLNAGHGNLDAAEELFRRGLAIQPGGVHYFSFALVLARNQKRQEAIRNLEIALERYGEELSPDQQTLARMALQELRTAG